MSLSWTYNPVSGFFLLFLSFPFPPYFSAWCLQVLRDPGSNSLLLLWHNLVLLQKFLAPFASFFNSDTLDDSALSKCLFHALGFTIWLLLPPPSPWMGQGSPEFENATRPTRNSPSFIVLSRSFATILIASECSTSLPTPVSFSYDPSTLFLVGYLRVPPLAKKFHNPLLTGLAPALNSNPGFGSTLFVALRLQFLFYVDFF